MPPKSNITAKEIEALLYKQFQPPEFTAFNELRFGTGFKKSAKKRVDFFVLNNYESSKHLKIVFEIKISRSDFLLELKKPLKRKEGLSISNEFYFCVAPGVVKSIDEVPLECGLLEVGLDKVLRIKKKAPFRDCKFPTWNFVAAIGRRIFKAQGLDYTHFSDDVLSIIFASLSAIKGLNASEMLLYQYIEKEILRRASIVYTAKTSEQRSRNKFYAKMRKEKVGITLEELKKLWNDKQEAKNKILDKKKKL